MLPTCLARSAPLRLSVNISAATHTKFSTDATISPQQMVVFLQSGNNELRQNSLLGPSLQYPLPGDVTCLALQLDQETKTEEQEAPLSNMPSHSLLSLLSPVIVNSSQDELQSQLSLSLSLNSDLPVEVTAQKCPKLLHKDLKHLFPGLNVSPSITVINLTQKTAYDQRAWSKNMETEREKLTASFISAASSICASLHKVGNWADFIDPSSGRPFLGKFTNATLFETDDAYSQMGFRIDDLGCCKVLMHAKWECNAFVGTIFTSAAPESQIVKDIIAKLQD